jgi:hypothetical protein
MNEENLLFASLVAWRMTVLRRYGRCAMHLSEYIHWSLTPRIRKIRWGV